MLRIILLLSLLISGCSVHNGQFSVPTHIHFSGKVFESVLDNQLDEMRQILYLPQDSTKNPDDWQQGFLIFLDRNLQGRTLSERQQLRQQSFDQQSNTQAKVIVSNNELQSQVLYPSTERFSDYQLEVTRGRDFACGFGQMQFADKRSDFTKNLQLQTAYRQKLKDLAHSLAQLPWLMECRK